MRQYVVASEDSIENLVLLNVLTTLPGIVKCNFTMEWCMVRDNS